MVDIVNELNWFSCHYINLFFIHVLIKYLNIFKSNTKLIKHRIYLCSHYLLMFHMCMYNVYIFIPFSILITGNLAGTKI
jgi:hypothetical protein